MRLCDWCKQNPVTDARARFCCRRCRQAAFRLRRRRTTEIEQSRPMTMAYADPPYPGLARKYYQHEATYAGEVDHAALIASLRSSYDGWALSTSAEALRDVLPLCPREARVCSWMKPIGACPLTYGLHNVWEPLIVVPGRALRPGVADTLRAQPARGGGTLPGRKPIAFAAWLFDCLGLLPGDTLVDLFLGTGIIGRAWAELSSGAGNAAADGVGDVSSGDEGDEAQEYLSDESGEDLGDVSSRYRRDASSTAPSDMTPPGGSDESSAAADDNPFARSQGDASHQAFQAALGDASPAGRSDLYPRGLDDGRPA